MSLVVCRECGRKVSSNAEECPGCGNPMDGRQRPRKAAKRYGCGSLVVLLLGTGLVYLFVKSVLLTEHGVNRPAAAVPVGPEAPSAAPSTPSLAIGDGVVLELPGGSGVWLATSDAARDELLDAQNAKSVPLLKRPARGTSEVTPAPRLPATPAEWQEAGDMARGLLALVEARRLPVRIDRRASSRYNGRAGRDPAILPRPAVMGPDGGPGRFLRGAAEETNHEDAKTRRRNAKKRRRVK